MFDMNPPENDSNKLGHFYNGSATTMLKESPVDPSTGFQHASALIMNCKNMKEEFLIMQGNSGHDCNCAMPRNIASVVMTMVHLVLEHVLTMRNSGGNSTFNPVEKIMPHLDLGLSVIACDRDNASEKIDKS